MVRKVRVPGALHLPTEEAQGHCLLSPDLIHQVSSNQAAWKVEEVDNCAVADILDEIVIGVECTNNRRTEDPEGVRLAVSASTPEICHLTYYKVVKKPGKAGSQHRLPILLDDE
jgi:hypothetical protein